MKTHHIIAAIAAALLACVAFLAPQALIPTAIMCAACMGVAHLIHLGTFQRVHSNSFWEQVGTSKSKAFKLDSAIASGTLAILVKVGSDDDHVEVCGAADKPIGVVYNEGGAAVAAEAWATVHFFGDVIKVKANAAIALGAQVHTADDGEVAPEPSAAGTTFLIGQALGVASADGDIIPLLTHAPIEFKTVANGATLGTTQGGMTGGIVKVL